METPVHSPDPMNYQSIRSNPSGRIHTETQLIEQKLGFSAAYMAVQYLSHQIQSSPEVLTFQTFHALLTLGESRKFDARKQAFFLFREVFLAMVQMALVPGKHFAGLIIPKLQELLVSSTGRKKRAAAYALSTLPVCLDTPRPFQVDEASPYPLSLNDLFKEFTSHTGRVLSESAWQGRSFVLGLEPDLKAVIKFARSPDNIREIAQEAAWMNYLVRLLPCPHLKFHLPTPVTVQGNFLFCLDEIPESREGEAYLKKNPVAIAYLVHREYFDYPIHPGPGKNLDSLREIFSRNAFLLGTLSGMGIVHTALIPLFHNRVQRERRRDSGIYLWEHGGRLDQWLESCRFPNFAQSGIRDFEHLNLLTDAKDLGHYIGEHILSFILVLGSLFRNIDPSLKGLDRQGSPADARSLFDPDLFSELIQGIVNGYYTAITGTALDFVLPVRDLVSRLIHGMGIDEHMEERLRIQDQEQMTDPEFHAFLKVRGVDQPETVTRAKEEITLITGPHLGGFNQPISVPELIEFLFTFSAMCVSGRYLREAGYFYG